MNPERKTLKLSGNKRVIPIDRSTGEAEYVRPEEGEVNTQYGFVGTMILDFPRISEEEAVDLFRQVQQMLGGDPDVARQYLNSTSGRHFVDGLSFLVHPSQGKSADIAAVLERSKVDHNTRGFWKRFANFRPYESKVAEVVNDLLSE